MPVLYLGGGRDVMIKNKETIERIVKLLPTSKTILLQEKGHALTGAKEIIVDFLNE